MISQYDVQKLTDLILENRDALNSLLTAAPQDRMVAAYEFANTDRELFTFVELLGTRNGPNTAADTDGWIEWGGGDCPVDGDSLVNVKYEGGGEDMGHKPAKIYDWSGDKNYCYPIIAYRVVG